MRGAQMTFANETPLERTRRELRAAKAALIDVRVALVEVGALAPDEHALVDVGRTALEMRIAIRDMWLRAKRATDIDIGTPVQIRATTSTPVCVSAPTIPTRSCPHCGGQGMIATRYDPNQTAVQAGTSPRKCDRCGGSGRVVAV